MSAEPRLLSTTQMLSSMNLHKEVVELVSVRPKALSLFNKQDEEHRFLEESTTQKRYQRY